MVRECHADDHARRGRAHPWSDQALGAPLVALGVTALAIVGAFALPGSDGRGGGRACACGRPGDHRVHVAAGRVPCWCTYRPGARRPVVLALPGAGMTGPDMARYTGYSRLADVRDVLVAYPTASGRRPFWSVSGRQTGGPDDVAYLRRVIGTLTGRAGCGAPGRAGVTGVSNGGG